MRRNENERGSLVVPLPCTAGRQRHIKFGRALKFQHAIKRVYRTSCAESKLTAIRVEE